MTVLHAAGSLLHYALLIVCKSAWHRPIRLGFGHMQYPGPSEERGQFVALQLIEKTFNDGR